MAQHNPPQTEYCPHHATCPFYKNWVEQTGNRRVDVITVDVADGTTYDCVTLSDLGDIPPMGEELRERLPKTKQLNLMCSHLSLLNGLATIEEQLEDLLKTKNG